MKESVYERLVPNSDHRITHLVWRVTPFCESGVVCCKIKFERNHEVIRLHMVADFAEYFQKLALVREQFVAVRDHLDLGMPYRWTGRLSTSENSNAWGTFYVRKSGRGFNVAVTLADCTRSINWIEAPASRARTLVNKSIEVIDKHLSNINTLYDEVSDLIEQLHCEPVC